MMCISRWALLTATAVFLSSTAPMLAADDEAWWPRWGMREMMMGGWAGPMMGGYGSDAVLDRLDGRLAFLKTELKITDKQEAVWNELTVAVRATAEAHNASMREFMNELRSGNFMKKPLPERLALQQSHLEARLEQVKQLRTVVDKLYAVLSDEQKQAADEIILPVMGLGMGRGGGFGPGMRFN